MSTIEAAAFLTIALVASGVATVTGFGVGTIVTPFAGLVIDLKDAIVLVAFFHFSSHFSRVVLLRESVSGRMVVVYGVPCMLAAFATAWLLSYLETGVISILFAVFLIAFSLYSLLNPNWFLPERRDVLTAGGILSGALAGIIGTGGAIRSMFLISTSLRRQQYIATSAAVAVLTDVARVPVYLAMRGLEGRYFVFVVPLIAVAFAGAFLGRRLLMRLPEQWVKRVVLVALLGVAIKMLGVR